MGNFLGTFQQAQNFCRLLIKALTFPLEFGIIIRNYPQDGHERRLPVKPFTGTLYGKQKD
jgi:hypothetical protein